MYICKIYMHKNDESINYFLNNYVHHTKFRNTTFLVTPESPVCLPHHPYSAQT